jgi:hypothetical protein
MAAVAYAGTCNLLIDGVPYALEGDWKVQPNSFEMTPMSGPSGFNGFIQKNIPCTIEGTFADQPKLSVQALALVQGATIFLKLVNGKSYTLANASWCGESTLDVIEGKLPVKFAGGLCREAIA